MIVLNEAGQHLSYFSLSLKYLSFQGWQQKVSRQIGMAAMVCKLQDVYKKGQGCLTSCMIMSYFTSELLTNVKLC